KVMNDLYEPDAYFDRVEELFLKEKLGFNRGIVKYWRRHPWAWFKAETKNLIRAMVLFWRLTSGIPEAALRKEYRTRLWRLARSRPSPTLLVLSVLQSSLPS